jgi:HK97 family phage major capsid protein
MDKLIELRREELRLQEEVRELIDKEDRSVDECAKLDGLLDDLDACKRDISTEERARALGVRDTAVPPDEDPGSEPEKRFETFGEQLQAVVRAGMPGGTMDDRLIEERAASGLSEAVPSDGGFLVQADFSAELYKDAYETGVLPNRCRKVPISAPSNKLVMNAVDESSRATGSRLGGVQVYRANEADTVTAKKPKFRQIELSLEKLMGICYLTDEVLEDVTALEAVCREAFAEEFGFRLDDEIVRGTGAGQMLGILNAACLVSVSKETGQAAATILAENIEKMYSRVPARSLARCEWYINQECWLQLFGLYHAVGTGGIPVFIPGGTLANAPFGSLLGRPIKPIEQCEALGTVGDIIFADFKQYLLIEKGGLQTANSIHVRFLYGENTLRFTMRNNGQPLPKSAVTPYKGSATISPFVALATRS